MFALHPFFITEMWSPKPLPKTCNFIYSITIFTGIVYFHNKPPKSLWGDRRGTIPQHLDPQSSALPIELRPPWSRLRPRVASCSLSFTARTSKWLHCLRKWCVLDCSAPVYAASNNRLPACFPVSFRRCGSHTRFQASAFGGKSWSRTKLSRFSV